MNWKDVLRQQLKFEGLSAGDLEEFKTLLPKKTVQFLEEGEPYKVEELSSLTGLSSDFWRGFKKNSLNHPLKE